MSASVADKVTRSDMIREYLKNSKDKSPSKISQMLEKEKGIKVSPTYVSVVKSKLNKPQKANKAKKTNARTKNVVRSKRGLKKNAQTNLENLISAKVFIEKAGGIDNAKKLIDVVNKILS